VTRLVKRRFDSARDAALFIAEHPVASIGTNMMFPEVREKRPTGKVLVWEKVEVEHVPDEPVCMWKDGGWVEGGDELAQAFELALEAGA
jgi:hypothetical protein